MTMMTPTTNASLAAETTDYSGRQGLVDLIVTLWLSSALFASFAVFLLLVAEFAFGFYFVLRSKCHRLRKNGNDEEEAWQHHHKTTRQASIQRTLR